MSDLLSTGISALLAYRGALDTAGHNIANVATPGYSRQRVELVSRLGQGNGDGYIGSGVDTSTVRRITDSFIESRITADSAAFSRADTLAGITSTLDAWLSDGTTGVAAPLSGFFDGLNTLAANPTSSGARTALLGSAETLAARFRDLQGRLDSMGNEVDGRIRQSVDDINLAARSIADLNHRIADATGAAGGQPPNDLLDQRDQLIRDLSSKIGLSTVEADDGSINVFTGSGQALVLGQQAGSFAVANDVFGSGRLEITFGGALVTGQLGGGELGGLLDARRTVLEPAQTQLGSLAAGLAAAVNAQHAQGTDATGQAGGDFFTVPAPRVSAASTNTGTAQVSASIGDVSALGTGRYEMRYDGAAWQLVDASTGATVPTTGTGTPADPFTANGVQITVSGAPAAGDRFLVEPTSHAAAGLRVAITDPSRIAAAGAVRVSASIGNSTGVQVAGVSVADADDPALRDPVRIAFTGPGTYSINGAGSFAYTAGQPITVNGWSLALNGTPASGDTFDVSASGANSGDNGNASALAGLVSARVLNGGRDSVTSAQAALTTRVGSQAQQAGLDRDAQSALLAQSQASRDAVAGVNLDEEASDLVRFQQAYQAAAQVIAVADTVFQTLLDAARR